MFDTVFSSFSLLCPYRIILISGVLSFLVRDSEYVYIFNFYVWRTGFIVAIQTRGMIYGMKYLMGWACPIQYTWLGYMLTKITWVDSERGTIKRQIDHPTLWEKSDNFSASCNIRTPRHTLKHFLLAIEDNG